MIFKALQSELFKFEFHVLWSKMQKIPEFNLDIIIIKDEALSFSWILLFLDVKLSHVNESCMMSHLNLSWADDMLILIDLKFCLFRGSFGSFGPCSVSLKVYFFSVGDSDL